MRFAYENVDASTIQEYVEYLRSSTEDMIEIYVKSARKAIDELKRKHKTINFKTVAEASGVSKATLYKNATLRARIESLRAVKQSKPSSKEEERKRRSQEQDLRKQILLLKQEKDLLSWWKYSRKSLVLNSKHLTNSLINI